MRRWMPQRWMSLLDSELGREPGGIPWGAPLAWWQWACFAAFVGGFAWVATLLAEAAR